MGWSVGMVEVLPSQPIQPTWNDWPRLGENAAGEWDRIAQGERERHAGYLPQPELLPPLLSPASGGYSCAGSAVARTGWVQEYLWRNPRCRRPRPRNRSGHTPRRVGRYPYRYAMWAVAGVRSWPHKSICCLKSFSDFLLGCGWPVVVTVVTNYITLRAPLGRLT